ncbi:hypothetical protein ABZ471_25075 [Streptomyces sp. NPDC005728]|uniref:hypothetical protein n=1 Tax=Streptomyces sp. NPDC005728 TaxID=3157054 RepID=UPI0033DFA468
MAPWRKTRATEPNLARGEDLPDTGIPGGEARNRSTSASPGRRRWRLPVAAAALLVLGGLAAGVLAVSEQGDPDVDPGGGESLSAPGMVACSSSIAEGRVARVERAGTGDGLRVVLDVDRSYKPAHGGGRQLAFATSEPDAEHYYRVGARLLVLVSSRQGEAPTAYRDGDAPPEGSGNALEWGRAWVEKALPDSEGVKCTGSG